MGHKFKSSQLVKYRGAQCPRYIKVAVRTQKVLSMMVAQSFDVFPVHRLNVPFQLLTRCP
ncbi:hypothetical protein Xvie_04060 [Xenorhabdus vietnamensis]|uniref:Uncharacterized protein n=1 Tax=Xenorhabdus vietnamensis TaxID=351656 RepID=A0A1Y2S7A0_9GAMM|nr:hypothetical protein Xvie_04060 [Xenorhabdus vietnamensis]